MSDVRVRAVGEEELGSIIDHDVEFEGELSFASPILVHGQLKGKFSSSADLFIGEDAAVDLELQARRVSIKGSATGSIRADERIELFRTARVAGSLDTPNLIVQSGARFNGPCVMADTPTGEE